MKEQKEIVNIILCMAKKYKEDQMREYALEIGLPKHQTLSSNNLDMQIGKDYIGVGCGAFILNENNELLLQQRNRTPEKGYWSIPGGRLDMFETFEQAVKREIKEETDLDV